MKIVHNLNNNDPLPGSMCTQMYTSINHHQQQQQQQRRKRRNKRRIIDDDDDQQSSLKKKKHCAAAAAAAAAFIDYEAIEVNDDDDDDDDDPYGGELINCNIFPVHTLNARWKNTETFNIALSNLSINFNHPLPSTCKLLVFTLDGNPKSRYRMFIHGTIRMVPNPDHTRKILFNSSSVSSVSHQSVSSVSVSHRHTTWQKIKVKVKVASLSNQK